jgi:hypothetical protein
MDILMTTTQNPAVLEPLEQIRQRLNNVYAPHPPPSVTSTAITSIPSPLAVDSVAPAQRQVNV